MRMESIVNTHSKLASEADFLPIDPNFPVGHQGLAGKKFILAVSPDHNKCQSIQTDVSINKLCMGLCSLGKTEEIGVAHHPQIPSNLIKM